MAVPPLTKIQFPDRSPFFTRASRPLLPALLALIAIAASRVGAQATADITQKLDTIAGANVRDGRAVGIVAAVVKGTDPLLVKAYGKSDVEADTPMTIDTILGLGSVTKQFTAAAILQLRDQGKLRLDDEITTWLPDFDTHGNKVTLRHLLGHTSGVADIGSMPELRAMRVLMNPNITRDEVYEVIKRQPFVFPTGTMQVYSNMGYWLLGRIVEKASGMPYEDYVEKEIFARLGMTRSTYGNNAENIPPRASAHGMKSGTPRRLPHIVHTGTFSAGALGSTVKDMVMWLQALHGGKVLSPQSYADMITPMRLNDGTVTRYGMGLAVTEDIHGLRYIGHSGGGFGFSSEARWFPEAKLAIVVLTNSEPDAITRVTEELTAAVLPTPRQAGPFTGDPSRLAGTYKGPGRARGADMTIAVTQTPEGLACSFDRAAATALRWVEAWTFRRNDDLIIFRQNENTGPATELHFDTGGSHFILRRQ